MKTTNWKNWAKAALVRAIRTFAEAMQIGRAHV